VKSGIRARQMVVATCSGSGSGSGRQQWQQHWGVADHMVAFAARFAARVRALCAELSLPFAARASALNGAVPSLCRAGERFKRSCPFPLPRGCERCARSCPFPLPRGRAL
jgi:hypothetical protein